MIEAAHGRAPAVATGVKRAAARQCRLYLSGRRRPGLHRHGGDGPRRRPRRKHHRHLRQQRHLRHDRRPDGADHPAGPGHADLPLRPRRQHAAATRSGSARCLPRSTALAYARARGGQQRQQRPQAPRRPIKKAFQNQIEGKGFSMVEVLSTCPTNWGLTPQKALEWIDEKMIPYYPLGVYQATKEGKATWLTARSSLPASAGRACCLPGKVLAYAGLLENREVSWLPVLRPGNARRHGQLQRHPVRRRRSARPSCTAPERADRHEPARPSTSMRTRSSPAARSLWIPR